MGVLPSFEHALAAGCTAMDDCDYGSAVKHFLEALRAMDDRTDPRWIECRCMLAEAAYLAQDGKLPDGCDDLGGNVATLLDITHHVFAGAEPELAYLKVGRTWARIASLEALRADRKEDARIFWGRAVEMLERCNAPPCELAHALCGKASFHHHSGGLGMLDRVLELFGEQPVRADTGAAAQGSAVRLERWTRIVRLALSDPSWSPAARFDCLLAAARDCRAYELFSAGVMFLRAAAGLLAREPGLDSDGKRSACVERMSAELAVGGS